MRKPVFTGTCTALVTPFLKDKINYPMLERLIIRQIESGIKAVVICGTTGESPVLSDYEKLTLFEKAKEYAKEDCKIIAGTGSNSTEHAMELSRSAEDAGADALLVVSPYYNKATPEGLVVHYSAIAHCVHLPIILYNVPSRTGVDIPVEVYKTLAENENIVGVKEASTDIKKCMNIRLQCPEDFFFWSGNDDLIVPIMSVGGLGVVSVLSNVEPQKTQAMTTAALMGDYETAAAMQIEMLPLIKLLFSEVNPIPVKAAMQEIGFDCGVCRLPLTPLTRENRIKLKKYLS